MALRGMRSRKPWIVVDGDSQCWMWALARNPQGYGLVGGVRWKGQHRFAHRLFYEMHRGEIPEGYVIDHLCKRPGCVNPDHLEAVPQAENVHRGRLTKLTQEIADEIKVANGTQKEVAERFGISQPHVCAIKTGARW